MRVWPFPVNWKSSFNITYSALTEIIESRGGREQRIGWRETPRIAMDYDAIVSFSSRRRWERIAQVEIGNEICGHHAARSVRLTAPTSFADAVINVTEVTSWMVPGRFIVFNSDETWGAYEIESVTGDVGDPGFITLTLGIDTVWPTASTRVYCGIVGQLEPDQDVTEETNEVWTVTVSFTAIPAANPAEDSGEPETIFNDREVLTRTPNWGDRPASTFSRPNEILDYDRGLVSTFYPNDIPGRRRRASILNKTYAEGEAMRQFFFRMDGRREEFYMDTGSDDLPIIGSESATTMTVEGVRVFEDYAESTVYKAVAVYMNDGTVIRRLVDSITQDDGNSVITVTASWGVELQPADVRRVSWLLVWRLASDQMTIEWLTDSVSRVALNMQVLEALTGD